MERIYHVQYNVLYMYISWIYLYKSINKPEAVAHTFNPALGKAKSQSFPEILFQDLKKWAGVVALWEGPGFSLPNGKKENQLT